LRAGQIVLVDWRDARPSSGEPNKQRPGIVVGSQRFFSNQLPFEMVVPLTGAAELAILNASVRIEPSTINGCTKPCYALSWNVQSVSHARLTQTASHILDEQLADIRAQIVACVQDP
jgi:mRNA interferase MazF